MKCGWQAAGASGGIGVVRTGERRSRAPQQAQAMAGLRAVVAQVRGSDYWGSADGGAELAQGMEALGRGDSAGDWWLGSPGAWGKLRAQRLSTGAALEGM